jgi:hypothetical protein
MFDKKIVAVMNENKDIGTIMNALAHISFGLGASIDSKESARLTNYRDAEGNNHDNVSEMPFIILKANSNKIRQARTAAVQNGIRFVDFTHTMTTGTYLEQIERSSKTRDDEMDYFGIVMFGDFEKVSEITKKFSLWK